jgi:hypothetical protein
MDESDFTPEEVGEMIAEEGQLMLLSITTADEYVPGSGVSQGDPVEVSAMGVLLPFSRGLKALPNSGIGSRDQQLLLGGDIPVAPTLSTTIAIGGDIYNVIEVNPLAPKGVDLFYDCTVRGAQ